MPPLVLDMLQMGQLDIAVINQSEYQTQTRPSLPTTPIMREDLMLICSGAAPLRIDGAVTLEEITKLRLVIPSRRHGLRTIIDDSVNDASVRLAPLLEFDDIKTIEEFVQRTDFFTILPAIAVHRALRSGLLKSFSISPRITRDIVCAHSPRRSLPPAAKLFIEQLKESMAAAVSGISDKLSPLNQQF